MLYPFDGASAARLLHVASSDAKHIDIEVISTEKDSIGGWETITFKHDGAIYTASCDTRYEGWYFLTPREG